MAEENLICRKTQAENHIKYSSMPVGCTDKQETGLLMAEVPRRIEQNGVPTALLWHPLLGSDFEDRLVSAIEGTFRETTPQEAYGNFS